jgi:hypothetical protein
MTILARIGDPVLEDLCHNFRGGDRGAFGLAPLRRAFHFRIRLHARPAPANTEEKPGINR